MATSPTKTEAAKETFAFDEMEDALVERVKAELPSAEVRRAGSYFRIMDGKETLAYVWRSNRKGLLVDVYAPDGTALPSGFKNGRGRARQEGRLICIKDAKAAITTVEGITIAASALAKLAAHVAA